MCVSVYFNSCVSIYVFAYVCSYVCCVGVLRVGVVVDLLTLGGEECERGASRTQTKGYVCLVYHTTM